MKNTYDDAVTAVDLKFFLLDEIDPYIVVLQNYKIGWNTNTAQVYTTWYHGTGQVLIGNLVTPKTNPGDYIIEQNADVRVTSDNLIHLFPGFHAQAGCEFHAYIVQENCISGHAPESYDVTEGTNDDTENLNQYPDLDEQQKNEEITFSIIPNPNPGNFNLVVPGIIEDGTTISLYDLSGKIIFSGQLTTNRTNFSLQLEKGLYLVVLTSNEKRTTEKLIIQ